MFKEDVTNNIYIGWGCTAGTLKLDGTLNLRSLPDFTKEEIHHLIWLLHEELKQRPKGFEDAKVD